MKSKYSNYKIAKENMIKKAIKLLKKYPINEKKNRIKKEDMEFIDKREIKTEDNKREKIFLKIAMR